MPGTDLASWDKLLRNERNLWGVSLFSQENDFCWLGLRRNKESPAFVGFRNCKTNPFGSSKGAHQIWGCRGEPVRQKIPSPPFSTLLQPANPLAHSPQTSPQPKRPALVSLKSEGSCRHGSPVRVAAGENCWCHGSGAEPWGLNYQTPSACTKRCKPQNVGPENAKLWRACHRRGLRVLVRTDEADYHMPRYVGRDLEAGH